MNRCLKFLVPRITPDCGVFDVLIQIEGRFNYVENEFNKGIIDSEDKNLRLNTIRQGLLNTINSLTEADVKLDRIEDRIHQNETTDKLLDKLSEAYSEIEKLKAIENQPKKAQQNLKIIIRCEPEISGRPDMYTCQCIIYDDQTGKSTEKVIPLRREPGGIVATIHGINSSDYIQIRVKGSEKQWESDYFSPQFLHQTLKIV